MDERCCKLTKSLRGNTSFGSVSNTPFVNTPFHELPGRCDGSINTSATPNLVVPLLLLYLITTPPLHPHAHLFSLSQEYFADTALHEAKEIGTASGHVKEATSRRGTHGCRHIHA